MKVGEPPVEAILAFGYVPKEPGVVRMTLPPGIVVPPDLAGLWDRVSSMRLAEDTTFGQWGLRIFGPEQALDRTGELHRKWSQDARAGDLVVGDFLGDSEFLLMRGDPNAPDFGDVIIGDPQLPREEWRMVDHSLLDFLMRFLQNPDEKPG